MAKLAAPIKGYEQKDGEDWQEYFNRTGKMVDDLFNASLNAPGLVGKVISFPVADGKAIYQVVRESPLTLAPVPYGDGYQIPSAHIRGLRKQDVLGMVCRDEALAKLFARAEIKTSV